MPLEREPLKRNLDRLPEDFMFQPTAEELTNLRLQSDTSNLRLQFGTSRFHRPTRNHSLKET
jgi:ORF6N domain